MLSIFDGLEDIKRRVKEAEREADRIQGNIDQIKVKRKEHFGFTSLSKAKRALPKLQDKERLLVKKYTKVYDKWVRENLPKLEALIAYWKKRKK